VYKESIPGGNENCVNAGAMLREQAERWVFWPELDDDDAAMRFEFPASTFPI
jgi:hypothetical protein